MDDIDQVATTSDDEINQYRISQLDWPAPDHPMVTLGLTEQEWNDLCHDAWEGSDGTPVVLI